MATFFGFNTRDADSIKPAAQPQGTSGFVSVGPKTTTGRKFRLTDKELVIKDFVNAMNIPQGSKPGNPSYGTTIWQYIFEPNDGTTAAKIEEEMIRLANLDPRLTLSQVNVFALDTGIVVEMQVSVNPFDDVELLQVLFDQNSGKASINS